MAVLKFRVYFEEDESIYRDVAIKHNQYFSDLHRIILKSFEFDNKHQATFFRSNDNWQKGREISLEQYDKKYQAPPLLMDETLIGSEIKDPNQKFIYQYDFVKGWSFLVELISVQKEDFQKLDYPVIVKSEGIPPSQYGTKGSNQKNAISEVEEKYDLSEGADGFGEEGGDGGEDLFDGMTDGDENFM